MLPQDAINVGTCAAFTLCSGDMNDIQAINVLSLFFVGGLSQICDIQVRTECPSNSSHSFMPSRGGDPLKPEAFGALGNPEEGLVAE